MISSRSAGSRNQVITTDHLLKKCSTPEGQWVAAAKELEPRIKY
jgi:hypothetical protein